MNAVPGIIFEKDRDTCRRFLRIDLEQYGEEITPFLEKIGAVSYVDDFDKALTSAINGNEFRQRMFKRIDEWKWKEI